MHSPSVKMDNKNDTIINDKTVLGKDPAVSFPGPDTKISRKRGIGMLKRPEPAEYPSYYREYVELVPEGRILDIFESQEKELEELVQNLTEEQLLFRYAPGKWSVKEMIGHVTDTERVLSYRAMCIARGEQTPLPGFNEEEYVKNADFDRLSVRGLLGHFSAVRRGTIHLFKSLRPDDWLKSGTANGFPITVRALAYIIAGHALHHQNIIRERYLKAKDFPAKG